MMRTMNVTAFAYVKIVNSEMREMHFLLIITLEIIENVNLICLATDINF